MVPNAIVPTGLGGTPVVRSLKGFLCQIGQSQQFVVRGNPIDYVHGTSEETRGV